MNREERRKQERAVRMRKAGMVRTQMTVGDLVKNIQPNPDMRTDQRTIEMTGAAMASGDITEEVVPFSQVRTNPFTIELHEQSVKALLKASIPEDGILDEEDALCVMRLPNGEYVDFDTPHLQEAYRRAGISHVKVHVYGSYTEEDCERIGIVL